ncbi:MarR family winged helix-turn-helix transcriptional regulator [Hirschia maritima]|uniref:MarR family winged helix-turn-helix transcriptional regulator n=1 Tax=Hirschia maritima TaxID=1121961 RepID=UPI000368E402|nr:MarR family transcriptional regulator [Hirschia maritima]
MRQFPVFHLIQKAHCALFRAADHALKDYEGLTATQHAVLFILLRQDGAPISAIADELNMGKSSLTGLIDRMSEKGFLRRAQSKTDARSYEVYLEDLGRQVGESSLTGTRQINSAILEPFNAKEQAIIERFLEHVSSNSAEIVSAEIEKIYNQRSKK